MLTALLPLLATSYVAWYLEQHELSAVYPFDESYVTPLDAGVPGLNETVFATEDGARLIVWRSAPRDDLPTVLYFPGNAGNLLHRATRFQSLVDRGFGVVAMAYRGSNGSTGKPGEELLVSDALALADSVQGTVILYGESLGAAVAIRLAAQDIGHAVVLEAPFTSLIDLVSAQYPMEDLRDAITQKWDNMSAVSAVEQPLLVIHGSADRTIPLSMGEAVFEAAGSQDKAFLLVDGRGHRTLWSDAVVEDIFVFLGRDFTN